MQDVILYNGSPALLVNGLSGECLLLLDGQPGLLHSFTVLFKTLGHHEACYTILIVMVVFVITVKTQLIVPIGKLSKEMFAA